MVKKYLKIREGGISHTPKELDRIRATLKPHQVAAFNNHMNTTVDGKWATAQEALNVAQAAPKPKKYKRGPLFSQEGEKRKTG